MPSLFEIRIVSHGWLVPDPELGVDFDPEFDLCSHGTVEIEVDRSTIVTPDDGDFSLSAAALHLLRTKARDHTPDDPVTLPGVNLIPDEGVMWPDETGRVVQNRSRRVMYSARTSRVVGCKGTRRVLPNLAPRTVSIAALRSTSGSSGLYASLTRSPDTLSSPNRQ